MYADNETHAIKEAIYETTRRRKLQEEYNLKHNIIPVSVGKSAVLSNIVGDSTSDEQKSFSKGATDKALEKQMKQLKARMLKAAKNLEFEEAAKIRDEIR